MVDTGFIVPIQIWGKMTGVEGAAPAADGESSSLFRNIFNQAVQDVKESESNLAEQQYLLATGQVDDPHSVQIAASEAQLSTNMLVQLRNKALDAYNELMRISL